MRRLNMWRPLSRKAGFVCLRFGAATVLFACGTALVTLAFAPAKSVAIKNGVMTPSVAGATKLPGTLPPDSALTLTIVLNRADQEAFEKSLQALQDPRSSLYRHYLSP